MIRYVRDYYLERGFVRRVRKLSSALNARFRQQGGKKYLYRLLLIYSFLLPDRVFTGDTLLIRGTGRTDFQNGDPADQYDSLFGKLLTLPEHTRVYPAHDYNGMTVSTIGEEKRHNPRLQVADKQAYIELMNGLELDDPQLMDIAVPANRACGTRHAA